MDKTQNIPLLGMGTWGMGGKFERDESNIEQSIDALRFGFDNGINTIDVAELYGEGLTEEIVGCATEGRRRQDLYIITKVWKTHLAYDDVIKAARGSLSRLKTDYIDLYLVHWPNLEFPLEGTMRAMEYLIDHKLIRAIGVSNFSPALLEEASSYLTHSRIVANEIEYNILSREAEEETIPYCKSHNVHVIAYRPFGKGSLIGAKNEIVSRLAAKYNKTPNQIALNWLISQDITAIPKSGSKEHLLENAGALGWHLDKEDIELLKSAT